MKFSKKAAALTGVVFLSFGLFSSAVFALDLSSTNFILRDPAFTRGGGQTGSSTSFQSSGSVGQYYGGLSSSTTFSLNSGYDYYPGGWYQNTYRWYANLATNVQPTTALAAENTVTTGILQAGILRLRLSVKTLGDPIQTSSTFKLQYASLPTGSTCASLAASAFTDVGGLTSGATLWNGYHNSTLTDGTTVTANLLSTAANGGKETYEETNPSLGTPNVIAQASSTSTAGNMDGEWDWAIAYQGTNDGSTFCFRQVLGSGTALTGYNNYPTVSISGGSSGSSANTSSGGSSSSSGSSSGAAATTTTTTTTSTTGTTSTTTTKATTPTPSPAPVAEPTLSAYEKEQKTVTDNGIVTKDFTTPATKCEFVVMNARSAGWELDTSLKKSEFNDINKAGVEWCIPAAHYAYEHGYIKGRNESKKEFGVTGTISRYEVAVIMARELTTDLDASAVTDFVDDSSLASWARGAVAYLKGKGIFKGKDMLDGTFKFDGESNIIKVDSAIVLYRTFGTKNL